jgi:alpha-beta hydrolase superfamily lysophospholipase
MKKWLYLIVLLMTTTSLFAQSQWQPDVLGQDFEQLQVPMPNDYEGQVVTTIIRSTKNSGQRKAVLYVHGFIDYFFQETLAQRYLDAGFDFYAVDLRKYGRSKLPNQRWYNVRNLKEYYADLDAALDQMQAAGYHHILLNGHSTGGLIVSLYAHDNQGREKFDALFLNSPFLDMNVSWTEEKIGIPVLSFVGGIFPNIPLNKGLSPLYGQSLHQQHQGEWNYNLDWKPVESRSFTTSWIHAIHQGHRRIKKGLNIRKPVLVLHSDKSIYLKQWHPDLMTGDAVLDVKDIAKYALHLGPKVQVQGIPDAMHDMVLSRKEVREKVYGYLFKWLGVYMP